jgi:excisionase family DNA binding protein
MSPLLLTINQAMDLVGVSRRTIYYWLEQNRVRYVRTAGGAVRIYADSLLREGNVSAPTPSGKDAA